jgi:hypothetical protein
MRISTIDLEAFFRAPPLSCSDISQSMLSTFLNFLESSDLRNTPSAPSNYKKAFAFHASLEVSSPSKNLLSKKGLFIMKQFKLLFLTTSLIFSSLLFAAGGGGSKEDGGAAAAATAGASEKQTLFSFSEESRKKLREDLSALQKELLTQESLITEKNHSLFHANRAWFDKLNELSEAQRTLEDLKRSLSIETQKSGKYEYSLGSEDSMKSLISYRTLGFISTVSKKKEVILAIFRALSAKNYKEFCEQSGKDVIVEWQEKIRDHANLRELLIKKLPRKSNQESQDLSDEQASEGSAYRPANQHHNIMSPRRFYRRFRSHNRDDAFTLPVSKIFSTFLEQDIKTHDPIAELKGLIEIAERNKNEKYFHAYKSPASLKVLKYQEISVEMSKIQEVLLYSSLPSLLSEKGYTVEEHEYWKNIFSPQKLKANRDNSSSLLTGDPVHINNLDILTDIANEVLSGRISADNLFKLRKEGGQEIPDDSYELKKHNFYVEYYTKTIENPRGDGQQGWLNGAIARLVGLETEFPKLPECRIPFLKEFGLYDVAMGLGLI